MMRLKAKAPHPLAVGWGAVGSRKFLTAETVQNQVAAGVVPIALNFKARC
jgi:hypothetical protein